MADEFDAVRGCKAWLENKRRYGVADFTPTQIAIFRQIEAIGAEAVQLIERREQMIAAAERAGGQISTAENSLSGLYAAFDAEEAKAA